MQCLWCGEPAGGKRRYCSAYCRWLDDEAPYSRWHWDHIPNPFPNFTSEMRSILLALRAMRHRTKPCLKPR